MESRKSLQTNEHRSRIAEAILQGCPNSELIDLVKIYSPANSSDRDILNQIADARTHLDDITETDTQKIVAIHIGWYEQMYQYFHEINHVEGMNKVMRAKERLLGIHKRDDKVVINKKNTVNVTRTATYDLTRLSDQQRERLKELMDKMR